MIACYKTSPEGTFPLEAPEPGCWVSIVAPTLEERAWLRDELGVLPEFVQSVLDDEESSHVDFDDDAHQTLIIIDCPFIEDAHEAEDASIVQYDTHPLSILFLQKRDILVTVSLKPNDTIRALETGRIKQVNTKHSTRLILKIMLNIMQRMSGIATMTQCYVKRLEGTGTRVLDTRKTTPGMRMLEKEAVKIGGGTNHRIGLFDMILLKDNHIDFCGGIPKTLDRCAAYLKEKGLDLKIEIECRTFDDIRQVMEHGGAHRIMLDNFSVEDTRKAVALIDHRFETESSGGITYDTLRDYAECGVDFISVGALTHSVKGLDMSFKAVDA